MEILIGKRPYLPQDLDKSERAENQQYPLIFIWVVLKWVLLVLVFVFEFGLVFFSKLLLKMPKLQKLPSAGSDIEPQPIVLLKSWFTTSELALQLVTGCLSVGCLPLLDNESWLSFLYRAQTSFLSWVFSKLCRGKLSLSYW